jgi:hypothetical protein
VLANAAILLRLILQVSQENPTSPAGAKRVPSMPGDCLTDVTSSDAIHLGQSEASCSHRDEAPHNCVGTPHQIDIFADTQLPFSARELAAPTIFCPNHEEGVDGADGDKEPPIGIRRAGAFESITKDRATSRD